MSGSLQLGDRGDGDNLAIRDDGDAVADGVERLEILGEEPEVTTCHAAEGLREEHDALKEEKPEGNVKELGLLAGSHELTRYS